MVGYLKTVTLAAGLLLLAPVAAAQAKCGPWQALLKAAEGNFVSLQGEAQNDFFGAPVPGMKVHKSLMLPTGEKSCSILSWTGGALLACQSEFASEADARAVYVRSVDLATTCLKGWKMIPPVESRPARSGVVTVAARHLKSSSRFDFLTQIGKQSVGRVTWPTFWALSANDRDAPLS